MMNLHEFEEEMSQYIRHQYDPVAVKMLKNEEDFPKDAKRPLKDFGAPFSLCQALALGRKEGLKILLDKEDQSCPIALSGLGLVRPDEYLSGEFPLAPINQTVEARKKTAGEIPRFEFGAYKGILIAPVGAADFDPDVIVFYGSAAQVMRMIQASVFEEGGCLTSKAAGTGGCLLPIVAPVLEGECKYGVPGNGERRMGLIADDEMVFAMPKSRFETVKSGLRLSHEGKQTYPISPGYLKLEYKLPPPYVKLRNSLLGKTD
jgi:uncharacterized protein (DUF169 family)